MEKPHDKRSQPVPVREIQRELPSPTKAWVDAMLKSSKSFTREATAIGKSLVSLSDADLRTRLK
jgi:hypothetical protein